MISLVQSVRDAIWSYPLVIACIISALYFSFGTRFVQIRCFRQMMGLLFKGDGQKDKNGTTSFQAFCIALSGRVGVGNVVGVATAIGFGGPGSIVWMWIIGLLGASTAFAESTLAQIYKVSHYGNYIGGPVHYISNGLGLKRTAIVFSLVLTFVCGLLYCPIQSHEIVHAASSLISAPAWILGLLCAVLLAVIISGGIRRIADFAQLICPVLVIGYTLLSLVVVILHCEAVPGLFMDMLRGAFGLDPVLGAILGYTVTWGVKRGIYSNEAGQGTGAMASGSAGVSNPVKQGLAQSFSIYIDTLVVCTATAMMILACGTFNVLSPESESAETVQYIVQNPGAPEGYPGMDYTTSAVASLTGGGVASAFMVVVIFVFAFTTIVSYYYYAESNFIYFLTSIKGMTKKMEKVLIILLRFAVCLSVLMGAVSTGSLAWMIADIGVGIMVWANLAAILALSPKVFRILRDYEQQRKSGVDPAFDPERLGIDNTECWNEKESL